MPHAYSAILDFKYIRIGAGAGTHGAGRRGASNTRTSSSGVAQAAHGQPVRELMVSFGWRDIVDLGDITTARGTEMYLPLWVRLFAATGGWWALPIGLGAA